MNSGTSNTGNVSEHEPDDFDWQVEVALDIAGGFETLPITARLTFVKNMIMHHAEGDKDSVPLDARMVVAVEVLSNVIDELDKKPRDLSHRMAQAAPGPT